MKSFILNISVLCLVSVLQISCTAHHNAVYNIKEFGAKGDGSTINTASINKAIEQCSSHGGGTITVPSGRYVTGTMILKSGINLHLEPGAVLIGSSDTSDYLPMNSILFAEGYTRYGLIYAGEAVNVSITGEGEINGNGTTFMNGIDKPHMGGGDFDRKYIRQGEAFMKQGDIFEDGPVSYPFRPGMMITFEKCERVRINGITMTDSPEWTVRIGDCDDVEIHGVSILNNKLVPNSDGIHCTTSRNIRISGCNIFAGDDAVIVTGFGNSPTPEEIASKNLKILRGNKTGYAENVTVTNCILSSRSACIRVGYGNHPIRNLVFSNLVMYDSNRGIGVFARDNSRIENVIFSDIIINNRLHSGHWWGKGEPIHISAIQDTKDGNPGTINNIQFNNILASSETGILISGTEKSMINNISLNNIRLEIKKGKYTETYGGNFDLRPAWPSDKQIFEHNIPGLYAGYVKDLSVSGFELKWGEGLPPFFTNGVVVENFSGFIMKDSRVEQAPGSKGLPSIALVNGDKSVIINCSASTGNASVSRSNIK